MQVRGLFNVPLRRLPASVEELHGRCRLGCTEGINGLGLGGFQVYETRHPQTTYAPAASQTNSSKRESPCQLLQLSHPFVQVQLLLPELRIHITATTKAVQGENPHINQVKP